MIITEWYYLWKRGWKRLVLIVGVVVLWMFALQMNGTMKQLFFASNKLMLEKEIYQFPIYWFAFFFFSWLLIGNDWNRDLRGYIPQLIGYSISRWKIAAARVLWVALLTLCYQLIIFSFYGFSTTPKLFWFSFLNSLLLNYLLLLLQSWLFYIVCLFILTSICVFTSAVFITMNVMNSSIISRLGEINEGACLALLIGLILLVVSLFFYFFIQKDLTKVKERD